jgi:hypothetical protein
MTRLIGKCLVLSVAAGWLCACAPQTRFEWGAYEPSLYAYYKSPSERVKYEAALTKAIDLGKKSNKVAPGLYAELGYMRLEDGDIAQAQVNFDEEMRLFPESRAFLSGVTKRMAPTVAAKGAAS